MRLQIAGKENEGIKTLELVQVDGSVVVKDTEEGWNIISFRVQDGKLVFARNADIEDPLIDTDEDGRIVEVEE